jgi:hypothetical protein
MKAQKGSKGIRIFFLNLGAKSGGEGGGVEGRGGGVLVNTISRPLYPRERIPVPIL